MGLGRELARTGHFGRGGIRKYRFLRMATPGPWTVILEATREVPRRVSHPSRKTIGIRVPDHRIAPELIEHVGPPLIPTTLIPQGEDAPMNEDRQSVVVGKSASVSVDRGWRCLINKKY